MSVIGNTSLSLSEEQAMLLDVARDFCRDKSPISAVRDLLESEAGFDEGLWREIAGLGWCGIGLPESCGGSGLSVAELVPVAEAAGRAMLASPLLSTALAGQLLLRAAGGDRAEPWLAEIAAGAVASVGWLENGDWGDPAIAVHIDDNNTLHGMKRFVTDAAAAQWFVVPAAHRGGTALAVVPRDRLADAALSPNTTIDLTRRSADVDFSGVRLADGDIVVGASVERALAETRLIGALLVAAEAAGSAGACLDTVVEYLNTRKQFGKLIGSYQALKHPCVDMLLDLDSARSFVYHAATLVGTGAMDKDAEIACRMAKVQANRVLSYAGDRAVQFHGGMGFTWDCDAQLYIRRAQWSQQQFGDPQHHRKRLATLLLG
jgi:alkylation response protein AidB-like acyl-CoA dehydrogenase